MRERLFFLAAMVAVLSGPAFAADAPAAAPTVQFSALALPVIINQKLINYVFVTVQLQLSPGADGMAIRDKEAFFRDDLMRAAHRSPFTVKGSYIRLDEDRMRARVLQEAVQLVGPGKVREVKIVKQAPQKLQGFPRLDDAPRAGDPPPSASERPGPEIIP